MPLKGASDVKKQLTAKVYQQRMAPLPIHDLQ